MMLISRLIYKITILLFIECRLRVSETTREDSLKKAHELEHILQLSEYCKSPVVSDFVHCIMDYYKYSVMTVYTHLL